MPLCRAYHDAHSPEAVYHNNSACPHGTRIRATERREGPGIGRALCGQCVRLDLVSWPSAPDPDEPLSLPLTEDSRVPRHTSTEALPLQAAGPPWKPNRSPAGAL